MIENIIIAIIIVAAVFFIGRRVYKGLSGGNLGCGCDSEVCPGCSRVSNKRVNMKDNKNHLVGG